MNRPSVALKSNSPISSVLMIDEPLVSKLSAGIDPAQLEAEKQKLCQAAQALHAAAAQLQTIASELLQNNRIPLIEFSVEIASRILAKEIEQRNYQIERIIEEAIKEVPSGKILSIKLNPDDLKTYQKSLTEQDSDLLAEYHLVGDWAVGPAQCRIETDQGILEWMIEEQLNQITRALNESE